MDIDLKKLQSKLRSYERKFRKSPNDRDGSGVRFLMGPYYLCLNDLEGAISHYEWFWATYSDSMDEPFHALGRIITELRQGNESNAQSLLKRLYAANPYLMPYILDIDLKGVKIPSHSNWEEKSYITTASIELYSYVSHKEIEWFRRQWCDREFSVFVKAYNNLQFALKDEPVGEHRSELIDLRTKLIQR